MIGRVYTWRTGSCSVGYWRVVCRWRWPQKGDRLTFREPGTGRFVLGHAGQVGHSVHGRDGVTTWTPVRATLKNVMVERVVPIDLAVIYRGEEIALPRIWHATTERTVRPWYPAPRRIG